MDVSFEIDELLAAVAAEELKPDHFEWGDNEFFNRFRFSKQTVEKISDLLEAQLSHPTQR